MREQLGDGRFKAGFLGCGHRVAHVFQLHGDGGAFGKVALHHALAMHLQNAAVGKPARDGFAHLAHVGPATGGEQQGLGHRADGDAHNHLVGQLGQLPRSHRPHMCGPAQHLQHGQGTLEVGSPATGHDGQRARLGTHGATRHRRIQAGHAQSRQTGGVVTGLARLDGRHVHHQAAGAQSAGCSLGKQHVFYRRAVLQHGDDDVGLGHRLGGRVKRRGPVGLHGQGFGGAAVPDPHAVARFAQAARHGLAHEPDAQHGHNRQGGVSGSGGVLHLNSCLCFLFELRVVICAEKKAVDAVKHRPRK